MLKKLCTPYVCIPSNRHDLPYLSWWWSLLRSFAHPLLVSSCKGLKKIASVTWSQAANISSSQLLGGRRGRCIKTGFIISIYPQTLQDCETPSASPETNGSLKRSLPASVDPSPDPPSKNRRKAHKPQKIKHTGDKEQRDYVEGAQGEDSNNNKTTILSSSMQGVQNIRGSFDQNSPEC